MFPKLKKRLSSFLFSEEGKISKQALVSVGSFLSTTVLASVLMSKESSAGGACGGGSGPCGGACGGGGTTPAATHTNDLTNPSVSGGAASATHAHHNSYPYSPCGW